MNKGQRAHLLSSLRFRLRLILLCLGLVAGLFVLFFGLVNEAFDSVTPGLKEDLIYKTHSGVQELKHSADLALFLNDKELLAKASTRYVQDSDVQMLRFLDKERRVAFQHGRNVDTRSAEHSSDIPYDLPSAFVAWARLEAEGLEVGRVELVVSKERLRAGTRLHERLLRVGLWGALGALVVAMVFVNLYILPVLRITHKTLRELQLTTKAALVSADAKSQFLANMSHEIRTPMNGVLGMTQLILNGPLEPVQHKRVSTLETSARDLVRIVDDILDFSKMEAEKIVLRNEPLILSELFTTVADLMRPSAGAKHLLLHVNACDSLLQTVELDRGRLKQVLLNLVSNSIKFTDKGAVTLHARLEPADSSLGRLEVRVEDTGIGIPESSRESIFDEFTQVDTSSTRSHEGTGLGLAISQRIVRAMGGEISLTPSRELGTEFTFFVPVSLLPVDRQSSEEQPSELALPDAPPSALPILVVDDNELNQLVASEILEGFGYQVEIANGGTEAVERVQSHRYALILMDCQMPEVDGYTATLQIRQGPAPGCSVPIVACTAHALAGERELVEAAGMNDYLTKPVEMAELRSILTRWVDAPGEPVSSAPNSFVLEPDAPASAISPFVDLLDRMRSAQFVELFLSRVPEQLDELREAVAALDWQRVSRSAHKLKGGCLSCGAQKMSGLSAQLEANEGLDAMTQKALVQDLLDAYPVVEQLLITELTRSQEASAQSQSGAQS